MLSCLHVLTYDMLFVFAAFVLVFVIGLGIGLLASRPR
jgi:hypothetical protein